MEKKVGYYSIHIQPFHTHTHNTTGQNTRSAKQWHLFTPNVLSYTECYRVPSHEVGGGDFVHLFIGTEETELVGHVCGTL